MHDHAMAFMTLTGVMGLLLNGYFLLRRITCTAREL